MAKKFYAVKVGRVPGIYQSWAQCQQQINGFSGAVYKGFATREEAQDFVEGRAPAIGCAARGSMEEKVPSASREGQAGLPGQTAAVAYVDGSYDSSRNAFSYGMVLFYQKEELHFSEKYIGGSLAEMHNVAGEIKGAEAAMRYCLEHGIPSITIYHDYEGIAKWCNGEWQAKKPGTMAYAEYYRKVCGKLRIEFVKVKGHSGDTYNDLADRLAKEALQ